MTVQIGYDNILENSTVTVVGASVLATNPIYRLYDRIPQRMCVTNSNATQKIKVDQGGSPVTTNLFVLGPGHNLSGATLTLQWSTIGDDVDGSWTTPTLSWTENGTTTPMNNPWTQSGSGILAVQIQALAAKRYWRLKIVGAATAPSIGEIFLSTLVVLSPQPVFDSSSYGLKTVRNRIESISGSPHFFTRGTSRRQVQYAFNQISDAGLTAFNLWDTAWNGQKPFFLNDHLSRQYFAERLEEMSNFRSTEYNNTSSSITMQEVL